MVQCFPVTVCRFSIFLNQSSIYSYRTVFIAGRTPCARTGYSIIIFLSHNGGFKRAFNLYMKFIWITLIVIFCQRSISIRINDQFKGQILIVCGCDGDHITTFQDRFILAARVVISCKNEIVFISILLIRTSIIRPVRSLFPRCIVHIDCCHFGNITISICKFKIPVTAHPFFF